MDVHLRRAVTAALRLRSIDVLTAQEDGSAELADDVLLKRATELSRVVVSQDVTDHDILDAPVRLSPSDFVAVFPFHSILSERSSPSRVRFAAPIGAPLTVPGRSKALNWDE